MSHRDEINTEADKLKLVGQLMIEPLSRCSFAEASALWNEGFNGYSVDISMSLDDYITRLHRSAVSVERSLVARFEGKPVGFLLNAFRYHAGQLVAWNGGTGVIPEFRRRGVGLALVNATLQVYSAERVDYATLEAISTNAAAIALYKSCGYETVGELTYLHHDGSLDFPVSSNDYVVAEGEPGKVINTEFYEAFVPWRTHWQSISTNSGQGAIIYDRQGTAVGYALFVRKFYDDGNLKSIALHDCVVDPSRPDAANIVSSLLRHVFSPLTVVCRRSTNNLRKSNRVVLDLLQTAGFTTFIEQVLMKKTL